jgi:hypothetical protein
MPMILWRFVEICAVNYSGSVKEMAGTFEECPVLTRHVIGQNVDLFKPLGDSFATAFSLF